MSDNEMPRQAFMQAAGHLYEAIVARGEDAVDLAQIVNHQTGHQSLLISARGKHAKVVFELLQGIHTPVPTPTTGPSKS